MKAFSSFALGVRVRTALVSMLTAAFALIVSDWAEANSVLLAKPWGLYTGLGFSGSTYGRNLPGIHLSGHARYVEMALYSTGATSELSSSSHQNVMLGFPFVMHAGSWIDLHNSLGVSWQHNTRVMEESGSRQTSQDHSLGLAFALQACMATNFCLRLEGHFGLSPLAIEQVYHENAIGSLGLAL